MGDEKQQSNAELEACLGWAQREFGEVDLGDVRRTRRLVASMGKMLNDPGRSIPELSPSWSECKGFYRLLDHPALSAEVILEAHREGTLHRASGCGEKVLLAVQDTTTLNFSSREKLEGRGPIGGSEKTTGLHLHNTLLIGAQSGKVFGLLGAKIYARSPKTRKQQPPGSRNREPIEQKESHRWIESFGLAVDCAKRLRSEESEALVVSVGDREADIYELLKEAREHREQGVGLLVRSQHNRALCGDSGRLWDDLEKSPRQGRLKLKVPRTRGIQAREVELSIRFKEVEIQVPAHKQKYLGLEGSVRVSILELREDGPNGLHWRLLSTEKVENIADAKRLAGWYAKRWQVEVLHRVLKSGCRVEDRQMREMKRLKPMIALDLVSACYLMGMISEARTTPEAPASAWLEEDEISALKAYHAKQAAGIETLTVGIAVSWIARLGGHLGRTNDGPPGAQVLWRGLQKLRTITSAWLAFKEPDTFG